MKIHEQITEENWCKGNSSIDKNGSPVFYSNYDACKWCALGWLYKNNTIIDGLFVGQEQLLKFITVIGVECFTGIPTWNDDPARTFAEVKAAFVKADL